MGNKVQRTCKICEHQWLADQDFETQLFRQAAQEAFKAEIAGRGLLRLDLTRLVQKRVQASVGRTVLGSSLAAQELKLSRTCTNCHTYQSFAETPFDLTNPEQVSRALVAGLSGGAQSSETAPLPVRDLLGELDQLLDLLSQRKISSEEFNRRQQMLIQF